MTRTNHSAVKTIVTTLCVALALVFVQMSTASMVNRMQHSYGGDHAHGVVGLELVADHHDDQHDDQDHPGDLLADAVGEDGKQGDAPTHHHHHSDTPGGLIAFHNGPFGISLIRTATIAVRSDVAPAGLGVHGPERPPKALTLHA